MPDSCTHAVAKASKAACSYTAKVDMIFMGCKTLVTVIFGTYKYTEYSNNGQGMEKSS